MPSPLDQSAEYLKEVMQVDKNKLIEQQLNICKEEKNIDKKKKAFITGTFNKDLLKRIEKALEYLGYSCIYDLEIDEDSNIIKKDRIDNVMNSDILVISAEPWGKYTKIFEKEVEMAKYLNIPIMQFNKLSSEQYDQLECQVTRTLIDQLMLEDSEKGDNKNE